MSKILVRAFLFILFLLLSVIAYNFFHTSSIEQLGQTGDFFGGMLNPIFGALGFVVLAWTLIEQRKATIAQGKASEHQNFENSFFKLFDQHNALMIKLHQSAKFNDALNHWYQSKNSFKIAYNSRDIKMFYMNLYHILKLIHTNKDINEGKFYANMIRATMSDELLTLLIANCWSHDFTFYRTMIEDYAFFQHLKSLDIDIQSEQTIHNYTEAMNYFDIKAYENNNVMIDPYRSCVGLPPLSE